MQNDFRRADVSPCGVDATAGHILKHVHGVHIELHAVVGHFAAQAAPVTSQLRAFPDTAREIGHREECYFGFRFLRLTGFGSACILGYAVRREDSNNNQRT